MDKYAPFAIIGIPRQLTLNDCRPVIPDVLEYPQGAQVQVRALDTVQTPILWTAQPAATFTKHATDPRAASFAMPGENVTVTAEHDPTPQPVPPRTGDTTPLAAACLLGALSLIALAGLCLRLRRRHGEGE